MYQDNSYITVIYVNYVAGQYNEIGHTVASLRISSIDYGSVGKMLL